MGQRFFKRPRKSMFALETLGRVPQGVRRNPDSLGSRISTGEGRCRGVFWGLDLQMRFV